MIIEIGFYVTKLKCFFIGIFHVITLATINGCLGSLPEETGRPVRKNRSSSFESYMEETGRPVRKNCSSSFESDMENAVGKAFERAFQDRSNTKRVCHEELKTLKKHDGCIVKDREVFDYDYSVKKFCG